MINLSVIIPFYNVEDYIEQCLNSFLSLNTDEFEIILINDGGQDGSRSICEGFLSQFKNIKLIDQENSGPSVARNVGLQEAKGEYISFCDSDDFVDAKELKNLLESAKANELDIAVGNGYHLYPTKEVKGLRADEIRKTLGVSSGADYYLKTNPCKEFSVGAPTNIYKREFLINKKIKFFDGIIHEDEEFSLKAFMQAHRVAYYPYHFYHYRHRQGSITNQSGHKYLNPKSSISFYKIFLSLTPFLEDSSLDSQQKKCLTFFLYKCYLEIIKREIFYKKKKYKDFGLPKEQVKECSRLVKKLDLSLKQRVKAWRYGVRVF